MNITDAQKEKLKLHIDNLEEVISNGDIQLLLDLIDDVIVNDILGNDDEPTELGIELQRIYDQIYNQN